jgi:WD40 repeat protein
MLSQAGFAYYLFILVIFGLWLPGRLIANEPPITAVTVSPDGNHVLVANQAGIRVFDEVDELLARHIPTSMSTIESIAFSPDGKKLAVAGGTPAENGIVEILTWPNATRTWFRVSHDDTVQSIAWISNTSWLTASADREIKRWEESDAERPIRTFVGHSSRVTSLCVLAEGNQFVSGSADQSLRVWDYQTGELLRAMQLHAAPVNALRLRPRMTGLAWLASAGDDRTVRFWQPTIGRMVRFMRLESAPLDIVWSPDGQLLFVACADGQYRTVDPEQLTVTQTSRFSDGWGYSIATNPSGTKLFIGGSDGQLHRFLLKHRE